jgi:hypothetical protein
MTLSHVPYVYILQAPSVSLYAIFSVLLKY